MGEYIDPRYYKQDKYTDYRSWTAHQPAGSISTGQTTGGVSLYTDPTTGISSNKPYVVSSANARGDVVANKIDSQNLYGTITEEEQNLTGATTTNPISQNDILNLRNSIGLTTSEEERQINEAGAMAGSQYDDLIRQAEEAKMQGLPKALVSAGQRGGLMNTQFAGSAALDITPEAQKAIETLRAQGLAVELPGRDDWFGAGGELSRIKSEYDSQIQAVQAKKLQAIDAAKAAARTAIRTGKSEDLQNATALYKVFQDQINTEKTLQQQKEEAVANAQKDLRDFSFNVAKDLEVGQSYTDPATGTVYQGYKQPTVDTLAVYDNYGNLTLIDKNTGALISQVAGVGKSDYDETALVKDLFGKYPDAGITLADTLESATSKLKNSSLYRKAIKATGSGTSDDEKKLLEFKKSVADALQKIDSQDLSWGAAYDSLKLMYPEITNEAFDAMLGGGYDEAKGGWWGRAKTE